MKRTPLKRKTPVKKRNAKRRESEFARCYGSKARVAWIKSMPCIACSGLHPLFGMTAGPSDNAHTAHDGMGRKAGYDTIVPLCRNHHRRYDERRAPFDDPKVRTAIAAVAPRLEALWQERQTGDRYEN